MCSGVFFCVWACGGKRPECVQAEASPRNTLEHFCIEHTECIRIDVFVARFCFACGHVDGRIQNVFKERRLHAVPSNTFAVSL